MSPTNRFEPLILGFLCNWCSYAGADLAGVSRLQYPTNVRIIRVMCSGRVDPIVILEAFIQGLDGVMVLGCHPGDCHYMTGNFYAEKRVDLVKKLLEMLEVSPDRLIIDWVSAAEGERFSRIVKEFTESVRKLGPLGSEAALGVEKLKSRLKAAQEALYKHKLRWLVGKERELLEIGNVFGEKVSQEEFNSLMLQAVRREYLKNRILLTVKDEALTPLEIADRVEASPSEVLRSLIALEHEGFVSVVGIEENYPKYRGIAGLFAEKE